MSGGFNKNPSVYVIGDPILDLNRHVLHQRPSPEDPSCPVCVDERPTYGLGGAANVAAWVAGLLPTGFVTLHGHVPVTWSYVHDYTTLLTQANVRRGTFLERADGRGTLKERIWVCFTDPELSPQQVVRIDQDTDIALSKVEADEFYANLHLACIRDGNPHAIVVADYGKGLFAGAAGERLIENLGLFCKAREIPTLVNSKYPDKWRSFGADFLICNEREFAQIRHTAVAMDVSRMARHFVVTRAEHGVSAYVHGGAPWAIAKVEAASHCLDARDVTGAGDAFLAGLASYLVGEGFHAGHVLSEDRLASALDHAQRAAAQCCQQIGCGTPMMEVTA